MNDNAKKPEYIERRKALGDSYIKHLKDKGFTAEWDDDGNVSIALTRIGLDGVYATISIEEMEYHLDNDFVEEDRDFLTHNDLDFNVGGTFLQGYTDATYGQLVRRFGAPAKDPYKDSAVDVEWRVRFNDGTIATIYNYKDGKSYLGDEGLEVEAITDWHIGGTTKKAVEQVNKSLKEMN